MSENTKTSSEDAQPLSDAQRGDLYHRLAKCAQDRHFSRRDVEWKLAIGLWSIFAAGALGAVTLSKPLPWGAVAGATLIGGSILYFYNFRYLPHLRAATKRDQLNCYYWESGIQNVLGRRVPNALLPENNEEVTWIRMPEPYRDPPAELEADKMDAIPWHRKWLTTRRHVVQEVQFWIAVAFYVLFVGALLTKASGTADSQPAKMSVDGSLEIDSLSKFKLENK
jgi:hypothetical protein